jgi:hypothetical protein
LARPKKGVELGEEGEDKVELGVHVVLLIREGDSFL